MGLGVGLGVGLKLGLERTSLPSTIFAWPAMGVRQLPSSAARKARSQETAVKVSSWLSAPIYLARV